MPFTQTEEALLSRTLFDRERRSSCRAAKKGVWERSTFGFLFSDIFFAHQPGFHRRRHDPLPEPRLLMDLIADRRLTCLNI